jgi:type IV secretion system protein VirB10
LGGVILGGVLLFGLLDGQRRAMTAPTTQIRTVDRVSPPSALPPLYFPPAPPPPPPLPGTLVTEPLVAPVAPQAPMAPAPAAPPLPNYPAPAFAPQPSSPVPAPIAMQSGGNGAVLVIDTTASREEGGVDGAALDPVRATRVRRLSMTVPQGTLIPAVLETALDSTRPGLVRAIVSRDITGFDGTRVLIPRGTRLFGEYQSDMAPGQNRALVQWTRLVRPDGVSVAIASPAADLQGRAGVQGRVDSHFLERFGGALLQSVLNLGSTLVTRDIGGDAPVIVASAGAVTAPAATTGSRGQATLRVEAGARVGVLVARDLEFSSGQVRQ